MLKEVMIITQHEIILTTLWQQIYNQVKKNKKKSESNDIVMIRIGNKNNSVILLDLKKIKKK